ncbi:hypothetical protein PLICRDRAFT_700670 [Plicaturopsis crispa FD-325 SS-3]|nr:hypothetical protein PLICRDRAFT_700670 [Plicaturopsis crispa FD-325 SS-3]
MPRGVPNAKRDDTGMRYTTFHVPLAANPKHMGTTYLKAESQTLWARNAVRKAKSPPEDTTSHDHRRGSNVLVFHLGSRFLRIGRAADVNPVSVPNVIARRNKPPVPIPAFVEGISRPRIGRHHPYAKDVPSDVDEYAVPLTSDDPFDAKMAAITVSLRDRMRFYKLRVVPNAANLASTFNDQFKPEIIQEYNDPYRAEWIQDSQEDTLVGEKALRIADPTTAGYTVRWPIYGSNFNKRDYPSQQMILSDVETILQVSLREKLNLERRDYKDHSVLLVIPDFYERAYVRDLVNIILVTMGFKQICVQQESLAATYGAGISNACVVDIGAKTTSIACVDEGIVIADTRLALNIGGDDITEFLYVLLERINFPYRDCNLARWYDWNLMQDLKAKMCTLAESDIALNLFDFVIRKPGVPAEKYGLRAYDESILAPMCIFEPRVIEFDRKRIGLHSSHPDVTEEIIEHPGDHVTQAMVISTQHLIPPAPPPPAPEPPAPAPPHDPPALPAPQPVQEIEGTASPEKDPARSTATSNDATPPIVLADDAAAMDVDVDVKPALQPSPQPQSQPRRPSPKQSQSQSSAAYPGGYAIDVCFEASKLPLDVAIFNSARAAGGDDKIRKYLQAVLVVGGTALVPGMAHALESRLQAIATPLVPNMEKVQILPPPKDVDPRVLVWKGAAVLGKMDGVADLWLTGADWDVLGMRGLKERCFYL